MFVFSKAAAASTAGRGGAGAMEAGRGRDGGLEEQGLGKARGKRKPFLVLAGAVGTVVFKASF